MTSWKNKEGIAVITHTYIERGPHQITVLVGDHFHVVEGTNGWLRGRIIYQSNRNFSRKSSLTVKYALNVFLSSPPQTAIQISDRIIDVVKQTELCQKHAGSHTLASHDTLSSNVDNLRQALQLPRSSRSFFSSLTTLSTWGRDVFDLSVQANTATTNKNSSIVIHIKINAKMLKIPVVCRFILYNPKKETFISSSVSVFLSPSYSICDLLFEQLDKRDLSNKIFLCIYTYELLSHLENVSDERKFLSFAFMEIEPIQEENIGKSTTTEIQSMNSKGVYRHILHKIMTQDTIPPQIEKTITRSIPYFQVVVTPHFGLTSDIINSQNLEIYNIVPPLTLPTSISLKEKRSILNINLSNLMLKVRHSKTRFILRLVDTTSMTFVQGFESIMKMSYDSIIWCSPLFNGKHDENVFETTAIDLTVTDSPLVSLFLLIQVDKISFAERGFTPCAYGVLHITNEIGSFTLETNSSIKLYPFVGSKNIKATDFNLFPPENAKTVGTIDYKLFYASTLQTQDATLFKLLNYKLYKTELKENISNFMFCGMSELAKFSPEITLVLCEIISTIPNCAHDAFNALISMYTELLSRAGSEYSTAMEEIINSKFDTKENCESLKNLAEIMLQLIIESLEKDHSSQEYRNLIRTLPYLLNLAGHSYQLNPKVETVVKIKEIFDQLCIIISENNSTDKVKNSYTTLNQKLLLQHFSMLVDMLIMFFTSKEVINVVCKFITSINTQNETLIEDKMKLLLVLSGKGLWESDNDSKLKNLYSNVILESLKSKQHIDYVFQTLTSILFSTNSDTIKSSIPELLEIDDLIVSDLILAIAYYHPKSFSLKHLTQLYKREDITSIQKLFVCLIIIKENSNSIANDLLNEPNHKKYNLFLNILRLVEKCKVTIVSPLDDQIYSYIYSINLDFSILLNLYQKLPIKYRLNYKMIYPILKTYLIFNSNSLIDWYYSILSDDFASNKNTIETQRITLDALWRISKISNFEILSNKFSEKTSTGIENKAPDNPKIVEHLSTIRKLEMSVLNQDEINESLIYLLNISTKYNNEQKQMKILMKIITLNKTCNNELELAVSLQNVLKLIPCNNNRIKKFLHYDANCGRELHSQILFDIVELYIKNDFDEYALPLLQQIIDTCIKPFQHIELYIRVKQLQSKIHKRFVTVKKEFSHYFLCAFYGNLFPSAFRNRKFIYRKDKMATIGNVIYDFQKKFTEATIKQTQPTPEELQDPNLMYIHVSYVYVALEEEINDIYYHINENQPKYIIEKIENEESIIFRREENITNEPKPGLNSYTSIEAKQYFFKIKKPFPTMERRQEIIYETKPKEIKCVECASLNIARKNHQLLSAKNWVQNEYKKNGVKPDKVVIQQIQENISKIITTGTMVKNYCAAFFNDTFAKEYSDQLKKVQKLRNLLMEHYRILRDSDNFLMETTDSEKTTTKETLLQVKEELSKYMDLPD